MASSSDSMLACPVPLSHAEVVQLAHGGGGTKMAALIDRVFLPAFRNEHLAAPADGATLAVGGERLAFTTDTFVVKPIFFPGGDIGSLAVHRTVNALAMCGAMPLFLSAGFVLEEGLPMAGTSIVTGDTKVVDKGNGDGIFINTTGTGRVRDRVTVGPARAQPGDAVLVSGPIGDHGIAVMAARAELEFETALCSDSAPVSALVARLLETVRHTHVLRDPTPGRLATPLCEIAVASRLGLRIEEVDAPLRPEVHGACELLGFDPLYVTCEGRFVAILPDADTDRALAALHACPDGADARRIGRVVADDPGRVVLHTRIGSHRLLERP